MADNLTVRAARDQAPPPHYRWNAPIFAIESAIFFIAMNFISATAVIPSLVMQLSGSEVIVGLASALQTGAWLLPQLLVAGMTSRTRRQKPIIVRAAWPGRSVFWWAALAILLLGHDRPSLTLLVVLISIVIFFTIDAVISVPWFALLAKCIPPKSRGRVMGLPQVAGGLAGIAVGIFVRYALSDQGWPFPLNYAILFGASSTVFMFSAFFLTLIREPAINDEASLEEVPSLGKILAMLPRILLDDRPFLRLVAARVISGFVGVAGAFYVLHATDNLGLGQGATGLFVSAQVVGSLVAGLLTSVVQDRFGPLAHIRVVNVIAALPPIIALAAQPFVASLGPAILYVYLVVFFMLGLYSGSAGWPFYNWILEYTEEFKRPLYIGIVNTLGAITMLAPLLGGLVAKNISYPATFSLALVFALVALGLCKALPCTRKLAAARYAEEGA